MGRILAFLFLFVCVSPLFSQSTDPASVQKKLDENGIEQDEVRRRMLEKGIDIDNVDQNNAAQLIKVETALEEVIRDIETESQQETDEALKEIVNESVEDIQDAVEDGAAVDEAIAEEIIDAQLEEDPPVVSVYGQSVFRDKTISVFTKSQDIKPSENYIMGPGDEVNISIWGQAQEDAKFTINEEGYIQPNRMPRITLMGKTYAQAKQLLRSRYAQYYSFRPEEFEAIITFSRTINISILGNVFNPGSFNLPATNRVLNALVAAGGPTNNGTVREIRLIRAGGSIQTIDVYKYLNDPSEGDIYLQENDIIHVKNRGRTITINGAVNRETRFELIPGENLKKALEYAGGLNPNAYKANIRVKRFIDDAEKIIDVNYKALETSSRDFELLPGDIVTINTIPESYQNFVEVDGALIIPGRYELTPGMRISQLVDMGQLKEGARTDIAFLLRKRPDGTTGYQRINLETILANRNAQEDLVLQPKDRLRVLSQAKYIDQRTISISGAVREVGTFDFDPDETIKVEDAIILAGGLKEGATDFGYIFRRNLANRKEREYIRINVREAFTNPSSPDNVVLQPGDELIVYSNATFLDDAFVKVKGAVRNPGEYRYDESLTLKDVLTLASGLRLVASRSRIDIFRVVIGDNAPTKTIVATVEVDSNLDFIQSSAPEDFKLQPYDQIVVRKVPQFEFQKNITIEGEVDYPGDYALINDNERLWSVVQRAGGLTKEAFLEGATMYRSDDNTGFVIVNLDEVAKDPKSDFNYILREGDVIRIPKRKDLVSIRLGNSRASEIYPDRMADRGKLSVAHQDGKRAKWYVNEYVAGMGDRGRSRLITVEHPNGEIEKAKGFIFKRQPEVREGSVITIGAVKKDPKKEEEAKEKEPINWAKVLADSVAQATTILTMILLLERLD